MWSRLEQKTTTGIGSFAGSPPNALTMEIVAVRGSYGLLRKMSFCTDICIHIYIYTYTCICTYILCI